MAISLLIEKGADINLTDGLCNTYLMLSILSEDIPSIKLLFEENADFSIVNKRGSNALSLAKRMKLEEVIDLLVGKGAKTVNEQPKKPLVGKYIGQKAPGLTPKLFAPNVVSTENSQLNAVFSPDGNEFYFAERQGNKPTLMKYMVQENGKWSEPKVFPHSGAHDDVDMWISFDGQKLYFCSNRTTDNKTKADHDFWVCKREGKNWGEPELFDGPMLSGKNDYYPTFTKSGDLFFSSPREGAASGINNIYHSELKGGKYQPPVKLGKEINNEHWQFDPFISPDGDYLIFASDQPGGLGFTDLHISFKQENGSWSKAINMGEEINTPYSEYTPMLSPDGKYLFFTSGREGVDDIWWVDAAIIDQVRKLQYFGRQTPDHQAIPFEPDFLKNKNVSCICFAPDGKEMYYVEDTPEIPDYNVIKFVKWNNGEWSEPVIAPFSGKYTSTAALVCEVVRPSFITPIGNDIVRVLTVAEDEAT